MKAVKQIVRKYYRYITNSITLPRMTSYTTPSGAVTYNWSTHYGETYGYPYNPFFGGGTCLQNNYSSSGTKYITYTFDKELLYGDYTLVFQIEKQYASTCTNHKWEVIYSDNTSSIVWQLDGQAPNDTTTYTINISANKNIKSIKYSMNASAYQETSNLEAIKNVNLTRQGLGANQVLEVNSVEEATIENYDFYKDVGVYKVPTAIVRHYYKYVYTDATSPVFASENQAVSGINNFKMTTTTSYWYITGNSTNTFTNGNTLTFDIGENNKNIKSIGYIGVVSPNNYPGTVLKNIQCSEDNQNWITISSSFGGRGDYKTNPLQITTPNNYRYIRFTTACDDGDYSRGGAYGLQIKYDARGYQESTSSDYDFYRDKNTYYGVNQ